MGFLVDLGVCIAIFVYGMCAMVAFIFGLVTAGIFLGCTALLVVGLCYRIYSHRQPEPFDDKKFNPAALPKYIQEVKERERGRSD